MSPLLLCREVIAGYTQPVVGPVSFALYPDEVIGIAGPNGAGKSTLLGAITGTHRLFGGCVEKAPKTRIVHHRQRPVRGGEMPFSGSDLLRLCRADRSALPERLGALLPKRLDRISGGQFQLLQVYSLLRSGAPVVLLDEPTNNLDVEAIAILSELISMRPRGCALVVVSHEHAFLEAVTTRVVEVRREL
jgi:zinc transport system ATP-binding protein